LRASSSAPPTRKRACPVSFQWDALVLRDRSLEGIEELVGSRSRLASLEIDDAQLAT
jgi:hypothetical protein